MEMAPKAKTATTRQGGVGRRSFIGVAGAVTAGTLGAMVRPAAATPTSAPRFDAEYDVVVCGSGMAGLGTALFSRWQGNEVVVLEKAGSVGGTTAKSGGWYWMPNNAAMKKAGIADPKPDFM